MINKFYDIKINFDKPVQIPIMRFVQHDSKSSGFRFSLDGISDLDVGHSLQIVFTGDYFEPIYDLATVTSGSTAEYVLKSDILSKEGYFRALVSVLGPSDERLTSVVALSFEVIPSPDPDLIPVAEDDRLPVLTELISSVNQLDQLLKANDSLRASAEASRVIAESNRNTAENQRISSEIYRQASEDGRQTEFDQIKTQFETMTTEQTSNAEVIAARMDVDGVQHGSLKGHLDSMESKTVELSERPHKSFYADIEAYYGNTKLIEDMQSISKWSNGTYGVASTDTINFKTGTQSIRSTANTNGNFGIAIVSNNLDIDLSSFNNGEVIGEDDYFVFSLYIQDINAINTSLSDAVSIKLSSDTPFAATNYLSISINTSLVSGWNYLKIKKSSSVIIGNPDFSKIRSIVFNWQSNPNMINKFVSIGEIQIVKKDPIGNYPNPFQKGGFREFDINKGEWFVGKEFGRYICKEVSLGSTQVAALINDRSFKDFVITGTIQSVNDNYTRLIGVLDNTHYIRLNVDADKLYLRTFINGELYTYNLVDFPLKFGEVVRQTLIKKGQKLTAIVETNSRREVIDINIPDGNNWKLVVGSVGGVYDYLIGASISEVNHSYHSDIAEVAKKLTDQPRARVYNGSSQSIINQTGVDLIFNTVEFDNRFHFNSNQVDRLVIRENGLYQIHGRANYSLNSNGIREITLYANSIPISDEVRDATTTIAGNRMTISTVFELKVGDVVKLRAYQSSGSSLDVTAAMLAFFKIG